MADDYEPNDSFFSARFRPWLIGGIAAIALGAAYFVWTARGERAQKAAIVARQETEEMARLAEEVGALEAAWREAQAAGSAGAAEARRTLEQAIEKQRERVRRDRRAAPAEFLRLRELEQALAELSVHDDLRRATEFERAAHEAREAGDAERALERMRAALGLLETVNRSQAGASLKDLPRESRLRLEVETLEALPLHRRLAEARVRAERAAETHRWDDVQAAFAEARALQARINREYPRTPYANTGAEAEMEAELETLKSGDLAREVRAQAERATAAEMDGNMDTAARAWAAAQAAQERLNAAFPRSRHATSRLPESWEEKRQSALSAEELGKLYSLDGDIAALLRAGNLDAARERIAESAVLAGRIWREFPRSTRLDAELRERVEYRAAQAANLAGLHAALGGALRVLPAGADGERRRLLADELSQGLYMQVTGKNPSRTPDGAGPVDSVSWDEAQAFCRRLGWLLGQAVRLPRAEEYRLALQTPEAFSRLADGLREWLDAPAAAADAEMIEGADAGGSVAVVRSPKTGRSRQTGFRVVVETGR